MANKYEQLVAELQAIEAKTGLYLSDVCVDRENAGSDDIDALYSAACMQAGMYAEEAGQDINALIGRVIY